MPPTVIPLQSASITVQPAPSLVISYFVDTSVQVGSQSEIERFPLGPLPLRAYGGA